MSTLKTRILDDLKTAMKAQDKPRVEALRFLSAAIKQREVDSRQELTDPDILAIVDKLIKQLKESIAQYTAANRLDLVEKENFQFNILKAYLPAPLSASELKSLIATAVQETQAQGIKDMGKVMAQLKPQVQGRVDMTELGSQVREQLSNT